MSLKGSVTYREPRVRGVLCRVKMKTRTPGEVSVADSLGLIAFLAVTGKSGVALGWDEVVLRLLEATATTPEMRRDLMARLQDQEQNNNVGE